jgi:uncharacterized repeat protein (TIGR01451 family)
MPTPETKVRRNSRLFAQLCGDLLGKGHSVSFRAQGQSMHPNLRDGDIVRVRPADSLSLRLGDIALAQTSDGLKVHRVAAIHPSSGKLVTRGDTGQDSDIEVLNVLGKVIAFTRNNSQHSVSSLQTRVFHPLASLSLWLRAAAATRLKHFGRFLSLFALCTALFIPSVYAQTADLQLTQTASGSAVATNATTQSLGTASTVTWTGGVASFSFPTPLPSGVFTNALLNTTGFTPAAYNLTNASITSVNYATGVVTVALASQTAGTATTATWTGNVASFTFPTPLPSEAVVGAQLTTTGFTPAVYNVTNATITSVNAGTGVITVALASQSLGSATAATWANAGGGRISFTFPTPLPSNVAVGAVITTTGFAPAGYNVTNATVVSVTAGSGIVRVSAANPGASTTLGTGTAGPQASTTNGTGTINPTTSTANGTGTVLSGYTYSEVVTNNSSSAIVTSGTITVYMQTPANTIFESAIGTNWTCNSPAVGGVGPVVCTYNTTLASGATAATLNVAFQIVAGTASGSTIQNSATVTNSTFVDTVPSNNTSITSILVEPVNTSDLGVSMSVSPTPVFISSTLTYSIQVQNYGQAAAPATSNVLTDVLPSGSTGVTFSSISVPSGWSCTTPAVNSSGTVSCSITSPMPATPAAGSTATIAITVNSPTTATTLNNTATVSLAGDPNSANNSSTAYTVVQPLACATPGRDGAGGTLTGIVNTYFPPGVTGTLASASTSVQLGAAAAAGSQTPIATGDLLLIIQTQGATLNITNTGAYGDGIPGDPGAGSTGLGSSGLFEFVTATSAVPATGGTLTFKGTGPTGGLLNSYSNTIATATQGRQTYQVIRVPQYTSAALSSTLAPLAWTGAVGGVLAIDASSQLTLGGTVALDSFGFRGGGGITLGGKAGATKTDYLTNSPAALPVLGPDPPAGSGADASKGEGIGGTPHWVAPSLSSIATASTALSTGQSVVEGLPGGSFARGAPGNAGGGGTDGNPSANDQNSGGGAGGNGGTGGVGGYGWNSIAATNSTDGGFGGVAFPASTSALVMGGGGGAGTTNNGSYFISAGSNAADCGANCTGIYSSGGAGGGIAIIHAGSVVGTGTITANGGSTLSTLNDSTGGGGAGGSILFFANSGGLGGLTVDALGGNGGNAWLIKAPGGFPGQRHGPGGGGGGGVIFLTASPAGSSVNGGFNGYTNTVQDSYGATAGSGGLVATTHVITETPGTQSGAYCGSTDLSVTNVGSPAVVLPGANVTYTQRVINNGPLDAVNAVFSESIPANTTFQSITPAAGWTCVTPSAGGTGIISCTNANVAASTTSTFTVVVNVNSTTTNGTQIADVDNVTSGTRDPNLANNTATVLTTVGTSGNADLYVTNTVSSPTVAPGANVTFTGVVGNQGPSAATGATFTEAIPNNSTFFSLVAPAGWSCTTPAVGATGTVTCSVATVAVGSTASFPLVVNIPLATPTGTVINASAMILASTPDSNSNNNIANASTIVASATQSDLAITSTATPNPVSQGNNITYAQTVTNNGPAIQTNATFTDTIPANTTLVSFNPPSGWTCNSIAVGGTGTFTCTLNLGQTILSGASVNFPLVVSVVVSTPGGTAITNTANISSTTSDPNSANNSVTTTVYVASPNQSDVSISKTAAPEPVDQNTNLVYTLQVSNAGPAIATGVTVTDVIPAEVTYVSSSTPQGSCTYTAGTTTLSCSLGSLGVGSTVVITVNVTADSFSSSTLSSNTATVSSTTSDPNLNNNSSTALSTIQSPTAVDISSFHAFVQTDGSILLEWKTQEESRNLGFHVYREQVKGRERVNPSLIAGSALLLRGSKPQHAAKTYQWVDRKPVPDGAYWIEDVDINGTRTFHGPVYVETPSAEQSASFSIARPAALLSQLRIPEANYTPGLAKGRPTSPRPEPPLPLPNTPRVSVADHSAIKISVQQEGWYRVSFADLIAAGLDRNLDPRRLHLYAEGIEQPLLVNSSSSNSSTIDGIEFYGTGIDTPFSGTRVYWLIEENRPAKRISQRSALPSGSNPPVSFPFTVLREDRTTYFAALLNGEDKDNFFGAVITTEPTDQQLDVVRADTSSSLPLTLDLVLQGVTDAQDHRVTVQLNGGTLGEMDSYGLALSKKSFPVESSQLLEGANTVTLTSLNGDNDVSVVQTIALRYPHTYVADADWLRATAYAGSQIHISGFTQPHIRVFDLTDLLNITELQGKVALENGQFAISLSLSSSGPVVRTILALTDDAISSPISLAPHVPTFLDDHRSGADIVIISHSDFVPSLTPLVHLRESQAHRVALITTEQLYDEYNFGEPSPYALKAFLADANSHWHTKPQSVLLVGDASFDPRDYLGLGAYDFVPTRIIETAAFKTACDDWVTDFANSGFATIPTGRLPVRTPAEADIVVAKIINYEQGSFAGPWNSHALFIADKNVDANFSRVIDTESANLPAGLNVSKIFADTLDAPTAHSQIISALNNGALLVDYNGHGAEQQWSFANLFNTNDAAALSNEGRLPVYLLMDCLNGFFHDVYATSLAESLLLSPGGGAVAAWASSGFTDQRPQVSMNQAFLQAYAANPREPLGRLVLRAKAGTTDTDVRRTWILFGDPAMKFQGPPAAAQPVPPVSRVSGCGPKKSCTKENLQQ